MTTANKITILRILLVPFFVVQLIYYEGTGDERYRLAALLSFAVAAILDGVDGYIARRYHQQSELGTLLDPVADKLLLVSGLVVLSFDRRPHLAPLPLWLVSTVFSRELLLLIGSVVIHQMAGKMEICPRTIGKVATVGQMITILWALLKWDDFWLWYWALLAALVTGVSGLFYLGDWIRQVNASPASKPKRL